MFGPLLRLHHTFQFCSLLDSGIRALPTHQGVSVSQTPCRLPPYLCANSSLKDAWSSWQPHLLHCGEPGRIEVKDSTFQGNIRLNSGRLKKWTSRCNQSHGSVHLWLSENLAASGRQGCEQNLCQLLLLPSARFSLLLLGAPKLLLEALAELKLDWN